jgi:hypothetical protein
MIYISLLCEDQGGFTKGERMSSLIYIWPLYNMHGVFSVISGVSSVKIWHPPRIGMEKGSEKARVRGNEWEGRKPV